MAMIRRLAIPLMVAVLLGGCEARDDNDGAGDAPIKAVDDGPWIVVNGVDRYPNIAWKCVGSNGVYTARNADATHARMFQVVPNDPNCSVGR